MTARAAIRSWDRLRRPGRWSLRAKLTATIVLLLAAVCLLIGVLTELALQHFLVDRLDAQLASAGGRSAIAGGPGPRPDHRHGPDSTAEVDGDTRQGAQFLLAPGQAAGTLGARIANGQVSAAGVLGDDGELRLLPGSVAARLASVPADAHPHTRTVTGYGDFRVLATRTADGDVLLTGLPLSGVDATLWQLAAAELAVAGVAVGIGALAGAGILRRTLRPLRRVASTATAVTALPLESGDITPPPRVAAADTDPATEVGQVGAALNRLLDHVTFALRARHASEMRVRQFVADASHELRTPLAAIRGYAELPRRSTQPIPPEIGHALGRIESETTRMTALVEDLLLLARLDAGRPLQREPVDLTQLIVDAVSDAAAAGPDHRWNVDLPGEPLVVPGDPARLHQVIANLLANARTHTPPGTRVVAGVRDAGDGFVALTLTDSGPGIPADLQPQVFQRFARAETGRARPGTAYAGTGLGLAIVHAIVTAHGGTVTLASVPGRTMFEVRLPMEPEPRTLTSVR